MAEEMAAPNVTLFRGFPARCCYVASPFVNKLEARLRMGGILYRVDAGSMFKAPRGKIPYVEITSAVNAQDSSPPVSETLADSALITRKLIEDGHMPDLNANLSPAERARDLSIRALLEDKLYFFQVRERWVDNYYTMRDDVMSHIPYPIRVLVGLLAFRSVKATLTGQGVLRFTADEAAALRLEAWEGVNALLVESRSQALRAGKDREGGPFWVLGGDAPTEADATLFGFVVAALGRVQAPATEEIVRGFPAVMEYARRIHERYFSDYERWQE